MRYGLIVLWMLFWSVTSAIAQVSIGVTLPGVSIGINMPLYPEFERVPGYPVYYAPQVDANFFFYDGMYWVYQRDNWYASFWYNGPWGRVGPEVVPLFVLRIPVRYYRVPPAYFRGWRPDAPPRWGEHWGNDWDRRRSGWDRWDRNSVPAPAPLPVYQRQYSRDRYPHQMEQQHTLHSQNYRYQPRDAVVRQHYQEQAAQRRAPSPSQRQQQGAAQDRSPRPQDIQRSSPQQQGDRDAPRAQPQQRGGDDDRDAAPSKAPARQQGPAVEDQRQQPQQGRVQREQQATRSSPDDIQRDKGSAREAGRGQGQDKDREKAEERGQERKK